MRSLALVLALTLAGCFTPGPQPIGGEPTPASFVETDCVNHEIVVPVDPSVVAPYLPDGYEAEELAPGQVGVIALAYACKGPSPHAVGMVVIPLTGVPEDRRDDEADGHGILLDLIVEDGDTFFAPFHAWGVGAVLANGTITLDVPLASPDGAPRAGRASVRAEERSFALDTAVRPLGTPGENLVRLFVIDDGDRVTTIDLDLTDGRRASLGAAHLDASGWAPLPEGRTAGIGFHEVAGVFTWTRVP